MNCNYCDQKKYFVMKLKCNHHICIYCINSNKNINKCCKIPSKRNYIDVNINDQNVHWYDTMYDYDNNII